MKIVCGKSDLTAAVGSALKAVSGKTTLPILGNVLISTNGKSVDVTGTDLDLGITATAVAEVIESGDITLPAKALADILKEAPEGEIELSTDGTKTKIKCGKATFTLRGLPSEDYPTLPVASAGKTVILGGAVLAGLIEKTAFAVSSDETRRVLNGVCFQVTEKEMVMTSTDGHRLAVARVAMKEDSPGEDHSQFKSIIPTKGLLEIQKIIGKAETVTLTFCDNHLFCQTGDIRLSARLIEGAFPDIDRVIPRDSGGSCMIADTKSLLEAVKRIALMATDKAGSIKFDMGNGQISITSATPDVGEAEENLEVNFEGEGLVIALNSKYVLDVLKAVEGKEVKFRFSTPLQPALVMPATADGSQYVIMPMRT